MLTHTTRVRTRTYTTSSGAQPTLCYVIISPDLLFVVEALLFISNRNHSLIPSEDMAGRGKSCNNSRHM